MAKKIRIKGTIGGYFGVSADEVSRQLRYANGEPVELEIASPGGSVFEGFEIFNLIKNYSGDVTARIVGLAASMATYVALAADKVVVESNAVWMIHNPSDIAWGDHHVMDKTSSMLQGLAKLMADVYIRKTGKPEADIRKMMDDEYWAFGAGIVEAGFADEVIPLDGDSDDAPETQDSSGFKDVVYSTIGEMKKDVTTRQGKYESIAAFFEMPTAEPEATHNPATPEIEGEMRTLAELKEQHPAIYAEAVEVGVKQERDRVCAHLEFHKEGIAQDHAIQAVMEGTEMNSREMAHYTAQALSKRDVDETIEGNPTSTADDKKTIAAGTPEEDQKPKAEISLDAVMAVSSVKARR